MTKRDKRAEVESRIEVLQNWGRRRGDVLDQIRRGFRLGRETGPASMARRLRQCGLAEPARGQASPVGMICESLPQSQMEHVAELQHWAPLINRNILARRTDSVDLRSLPIAIDIYVSQFRRLRESGPSWMMDVGCMQSGFRITRVSQQTACLVTNLREVEGWQRMNIGQNNRCRAHSEGANGIEPGVLVGASGLHFWGVGSWACRAFPLCNCRQTSNLFWLSAIFGDATGANSSNSR